MTLTPLLWPRRADIAATPCSKTAGKSVWITTLTTSGASTSTDSTPLPRPSGNMMASSIADTIYGQVHLFPRLVETGLLISSETRTVVLWNATFKTIELQHLGESQPAGSQLTGFTPQTILPTGEVRGVLSVTTAGPAQQHTVYTFTTSAGSPALTITASRVLLFPFWPDWGAGISIDYVFDTVVARSDDGKEQRRPLATRPLRRLQATVWGNGLAGQRMRNLIQQGKDRVFGAPIWSEAVTVSAIDPTGTRVSVAEDIATHWNLTRLCELIMLHDTEHNVFYAVSVKAVDVDSRVLTLTAALSGLALGTRPIRLVPLFLGMLVSAEPTSVTDDLETWAVAFQEVAGSQPLWSGKAPSASASLSLWPYQPDWSASGSGAPSAKTALVRTVRTVRGGIMELGTRQGTAPASLTQGYLLQRAELAAFLDSVTALRGRWGRFLVHEPRLAFTLTAEALPNKSELQVQDNGFLQANASNAPAVRIWIRVPPDTRNQGATEVLLQRSILHAEPGVSGTLVLHLDQPHGVTIPRASRIGRAYVARLDTDAVRVQYSTATVARCALEFYELVDAEPAAR
ncbi:MAG: hypothetical protein RRY20_03730 [Bilophila sp.]